jgi:hypothetical protein
MTEVLRRELAHRDTRCRHCWARIRRGAPIAYDGAIVFHVECPPRFTGFPRVDRLTDEGEAPDEMGLERDDYYESTRSPLPRDPLSPT